MNDSPVERESPDRAPGVTAAADGNPFPGLRPFRPGEEHLFFGRERQVDAMIEKLARTRFLAVVGTSGSGKSSLVNCGLLPALFRGLMTTAGPAWRTVQFHPGGNPLPAMAGAIAGHSGLYSGYHGNLPLADIVETHLRMSSRGLVDVVRKARLPERTNLLLVVDQFEELFRYRRLRRSTGPDQSNAAEDSTAFVNLLLEAPAHTTDSIYVVLTMRSDFLGDCSLFHGLPEAINDSPYLVPRLTRDERRAAIAGPVAVSGAQIDPVLLTRLVNDVGENPDQLSILQHALNRTWARWRHGAGSDRPISLDDYEAIGTMSEALDRHAEKAYHELAEGRPRLLCERVFKALTDTGTDARGVRRPAEFDTLRAVTGASYDELVSVIDVFRKPSRSFLMPPMSESPAPATVIDISHESLMRVWRRLGKWAEEEAQSARIYRRLADDAALHTEGHVSLRRDPELQLALDWRRRQEPSRAWADLYEGRFESAMSFLDRSREVRDRALAEAEFERRWRSRWRIPVAMLAIALLLVGLDQFFQYYSDLLAVFLAERLASVPVPEWLINGTARAVSVLVVFTVTGMPAVLTYVLLEHYGKRANRRATFDRILREIADDAVGPIQEIATAAEEAVEPDVFWRTSYAPAGPRLVASVIDGVVSIGIFFLSFAVVAIVESLVETVVSGSASNEMTDIGVFCSVGLWVVLSCLYQAIPSISAAQATPGMRTAGVFIVSSNGRRLSFARALLRHLTKPLSYGLGIGLLMQLYTARRQALHDVLSRSVVLCRTAEQEDAEFLPAPTPRRVLAFVLDVCVALGLFFVVVLGMGVTVGIEDEMSDLKAAAMMVAWLVACWLYQAWTISSARQASLGMRGAGVYVADSAGGRLSFARSAWRHLAKLLSYSSLIGLFMQPFTAKKQTLHDLLSRSVVLSGRPHARFSLTSESTETHAVRH